MKYRYCLAIITLLFFFSTLIGQEDSLPRWPQFRGPNSSAVAPDKKKLPVHFGPGKNVLWKVPLPSGWSSPCIWGDYIFLTGYDEEARKLETLCLDRRNGNIRWRRTAPAKSIEKVYMLNSPAAATPATDGKRVYVSFGSFGLLCYDFDGKEIWRLPLPTPRARFGTATSPITAGDLVLINSQGKDLHLLAVDAATGKKVWDTEGTPFPSDYPVPLLWKNGDTTEAIVPGRGGLIAYNLKNGEKRWWIPGLSVEVNSSPAQGGGLLFVASHMPGGDPEMRFTLPDFSKLLKEHDKNKDEKLSAQETPKDVLIFNRGGKGGIGEIRLHQMFWLFDKNRDRAIDRDEWHNLLKNPFDNSLLAIRPGGEGDISDTHIAWQVRRGVPEVPSPVYYQGRVYMVRNGGVISCINAKTGKEIFPRSRLGATGIYYASPVAGDGKIYFCSDRGIVTVLKAGNRYEVLAENDFGDTIRATPALVDGKIYLRTAGHLYALAEK